MARAVLRKRIREDAELDKYFDLLRSAAPEESTDFCRGIAVTAPHCDTETMDEIAAYAASWGHLPADGDAEAVRGRLLAKSCLMTEVIGPDDPRAGGTAKQAAGYGTPAPDPGYEQLPVHVGYDDLTEDEKASVGVDQQISPVAYIRAEQNWTVGKNGAPGLGTAAQAMRLIGADWAIWPPFDAPPDRDGHDVNVVIVDEGFNLDYLRSILPGVDYGGGFIDRDPRRPLPGRFVDPFHPAPGWHANMIARNILRIAPRARIFDAPVLPHRVSDIDAFTYDVQELYIGILKARLTGPWRNQPWILVNAWSVADTIEEWDTPVPPAKHYSNGDEHPLNILTQVLGNFFDIVFAAGNFGEFEPAQFSGIYDRGPERSIRGSNALSNVLTVGACTTTGDWVGASSQGDGPEALKYGRPGSNKPDLCAPAWFSEDADPATVSSGTSAACGVAAGVLAALRTTDRTSTPQQLFDALKAAAVRPDGTGWNNRTGMGILRVPTASASASVA
ncbi:S8 family serine peptidase [Halovulum marinum]|nr:S8 family serine peptidase [Halovulum marinum]